MYIFHHGIRHRFNDTFRTLLNFYSRHLRAKPETTKGLNYLSVDDMDNMSVLICRLRRDVLLHHFIPHNKVQKRSGQQIHIKT